jgi:hypothetical protein
MIPLQNPPWPPFSEAVDFLIESHSSPTSPFEKGGSRGICPNESISKSPLAPLGLWFDIIHPPSPSSRASVPAVDLTLIGKKLSRKDAKTQSWTRLSVNRSLMPDRIDTDLGRMLTDP